MALPSTPPGLVGPVVSIVDSPGFGYVAAQAVEGVGGFSTIERGGLIGLLFLVVVGALQEWWVPGRQYRRTEAERARLQGIIEASNAELARSADLLADALRGKA